MSKYYCSKLLTIHKIYNFVPYRCRNNSENTATQQRKTKINKNLDDENAMFLTLLKKMLIKFQLYIKSRSMILLIQLLIRDKTKQTTMLKQNIQDE